MNSPPGSAVPNSHDVSKRLVTDTNAASDAEVTQITAPVEQDNEPQLAAAVRARTTSPSWWQRATGRAGGTPTGVTVHPPRDIARTTGGVRYTSSSPSCTTPSLSPRYLQEQLATLTLQAGIAEATARIVAAEQDAALGRRKMAEHLLATADMSDAFARRSRLPSQTLDLTGQHPSPPPSCPTATSDLARVMQAFEDRHLADCRAAMEREERAEARALARGAEFRAERAATDARFAALVASDRRPTTQHVIGAALKEFGVHPVPLAGPPGSILYRWPARAQGWVLGKVVRVSRAAAGFSHVVRYARGSTLGVTVGVAASLLPVDGPGSADRDR
jgi:hypothetical protein